MKIAIIEDMAMMMSLWYQYLEETKHEARLMTSDPEDIADLDAYQPDLIVCSGLPRKQTVDSLVEAVRGRSGLKDPALVAVSGREGEAVKSDWEANGVECIVAKPFDRESVLGLVEKYDAGARKSRQSPLAVVVDDDASVRGILTTEMESLGFRVEAANNANDGYALIGRVLPDIALVGSSSPEQSGLELCARLSANPQTVRLPTLMISDKVGERSFKKAFESGVIDHLPKPVESAELVRAVFTAMGRRQVVSRYTALILEHDKSAASVVAKSFE